MLLKIVSIDCSQATVSAPAPKLDTLPGELLYSIMHFLDACSLARLAQTCRQLRVWTNDFRYRLRTLDFSLSSPFDTYGIKLCYHLPRPLNSPHTIRTLNISGAVIYMPNFFGFLGDMSSTIESLSLERCRFTGCPPRRRPVFPNLSRFSFMANTSNSKQNTILFAAIIAQVRSDTLSLCLDHSLLNGRRLRSALWSIRDRIVDFSFSRENSLVYCESIWFRTPLSYQFSNLVALDLSGRHFGNWALQALTHQIPHVRRLGLGMGDFTNSWLTTLMQNCPLIEYLDISDCSRLSNPVVTSLIQQRNIRWLNISHTSFTNTGIRRLINQGHLETVVARSMRCLGSTVFSGDNLFTNTVLVAVDFSGNSLLNNTTMSGFPDSRRLALSVHLSSLKPVDRFLNYYRRHPDMQDYLRLNTSELPGSVLAA